MPAKRREKPLKQKPAFKQLKKLIDQPGDRDLVWYHRVGKVVEKLCPDREYGESKIESLVNALGQPKSFTQKMWNARRIAREYDRDRVKKLSQPSVGGSYRLTWSHMVHILSLDEPDRQKFENDCVRNEWSTKKLESEIQQYRGRQGRGGRKFQQPESLEDGLRQLISESEDWQRRFHEVWFRAEDPAIDLDDKVASTKGVVELCQEAVDVLESMQHSIKQRLPNLRNLSDVKRKPRQRRG